MLKTIFLRALGRKKAAAFCAVALVVLLVAGTATAVTYTGSKKVSLKLNKGNFVATALTRLASNAVGPALTLETDSTDPSATPLKLDTETGSQAPMTVDSSTKVANLNAEQVDGMSSEQFATGTNGKATNADKLDDIDSAGFIQGGGTATRGALASNPGQFSTFLATPDFRLAYSCPGSDITNNTGILRIRNLSTTETVNLFSDNGGVNPNHYGQLNTDDGSANDPDSKFDQNAAASGEFITLGLQGSYVATIHVFSVHRTSDNRCHVQAQALTTR
jgi:hypothetical protein